MQIYFNYVLFYKKLLFLKQLRLKVFLKNNFVEGTALLARTHSMSSCAGYHTPIEDEVAGSVINDGEVGSDVPSELYGFGLTPRGGSLLQVNIMIYGILFKDIIYEHYNKKHT